MVYAGMLAHGTALSAAETARMIPQVSAPAVRQAMRWAADERGSPRPAAPCSHSCIATPSRPRGAVLTWPRLT